jgi:hypothetical protein
LEALRGDSDTDVDSGGLLGRERFIAVSGRMEFSAQPFEDVELDADDVSCFRGSRLSQVETFLG